MQVCAQKDNLSVQRVITIVLVTHTYMCGCMPYHIAADVYVKAEYKSMHFKYKKTANLDS